MDCSNTSGLFELMEYQVQQAFEREVADRDHGAASPDTGRTRH